MKPALVAAALISLSVIGCASPGLPNGYNVEIDSSFSTEEIAAIETGVSSWTALSDSAPSFTFSIVDPFSMPSEKDVDWTTIVIHKATLSDIRSVSGATAIAYTSLHGELSHVEFDVTTVTHKAIGPSVYIPGFDEIDSKVLNSNIHYTHTDIMFLNAAHETGHSMGMHHMTNESVMQANLFNDPKTGPSCDDLSYYCSLRGMTCTCNQ